MECSELANYEIQDVVFYVASQHIYQLMHFAVIHDREEFEVKDSHVQLDLYTIFVLNDMDPKILQAKVTK